MKNYTYINSKLYNELLQEGGDNLVAVFSMLKFHKNGKIKYYKEKENIYVTLKKRTKLSLTTLRKYVKILKNLGLVRIDTAGNFVILGTEKINKLYHKNKRPKFVKIEIGTYTQTKVFSFRVRVLAMERIQKGRIDRRDRLSKIIWRASKGYALSNYELSSLKNQTETDSRYASEENTFTTKTVLSNQGFSQLKFGETKSKASGQYWKNKLISAKIIEVKRRFKFIKKCTYQEYRWYKFNIDKSLVYRKGRMFKELVPEFTTTISPTKENKIQKLSYLQFDFCYFLAQQSYNISK